ncbi:MAG: IS110 family transposase [Chloroflexota bacterium]|nr:IS110 family transposase [Chloroflexota bacterium]
MGRSIGLDVHRDFCQVAIADGGRARAAGRIATTPEQLELFARSLAPDDRVVMEATGNALAIARIVHPHVAEVVLAHAKQVRAISHARVKTDKIDARVLADLLAADLIPNVWIGDDRTRMLRRLVSRRRGLVKRRTQVKNEVSAVMHRNLKGRNPASDPFSKKGRTWIAAQQLPVDERLTVDAGLRQLDFLGDELAQIDAIIAQQVLGDEDVRRLMTIPGIDVVTAATLIATIGDIHRFPTSRQLVGYLGLHPTIRQSGNGPARHGRVSKEGSAAARHVLVEALGRPPRAQDRCARSRTAPPPGADATSRPSPSRASSRCWRGSCSRAVRTTHSHAQASCAASCVRSSVPPARHAPSPARSPTRSGTPATRLPNAASPSRPRPPTDDSSPTGGPAARKRVRARHRSAHLKRPSKGKAARQATSS